MHKETPSENSPSRVHLPRQFIPIRQEPAIRIAPHFQRLIDMIVSFVIYSPLPKASTDRARFQVSVCPKLSPLIQRKEARQIDPPRYQSKLIILGALRYHPCQCNLDLESSPPPPISTPENHTCMNSCPSIFPGKCHKVG